MFDIGKDAPVTHAELNAGMRTGEVAIGAGRWRDALAAYKHLLERILARRIDHGASWKGADLQIIERLAELATLFCLGEAADNLLRAMFGLAVEAGNDLTADYAQLKRAEMQLAGGHTHAAYGVLGSLAPRIGRLDEIDLSSYGLRRWEEEIAWRSYPRADRNMLLTRGYICMGHILLNWGRYAESLCMLARGLDHAAVSDSPDFAGQAANSLHLLRARAQLEMGRLAEGQSSLALVAADGLSIGARIGHRELSAKIHFLQGRLGQAVESFRSVRDECVQGGFPRAQAVAALNLAHALVLQNRVGDALALCAEALEIAQVLGDGTLAGLASAIGQIAQARRNSQVEAVAIRLTVKNMVENAIPGHATVPVERAGLGASADGASFLGGFEDGAISFLWALDGPPYEAEARLAALVQVYANCGSDLISVRLRVLAGQLAAAQGEHELALTSFAAAMGELTQLGMLPELWQATQLHVRSLIRLGRENEAATAAADAEQVLGEMCATLPSEDRAVFLLNKFTVQEEYLVAQAGRLVDDATAGVKAGLLVRLRSRYRVLRRLRELLTTLVRYRADAADRQCGSALRVVRKRSGLLHLAGGLGRHSRDRATIVFVVLPDRVLIIWTAFMAMGFLVSPITRIALRELVRQWHEYTQDSLCRVDEGMTQSELAEIGAEGEACMDRLADALQLDALLEALPASVTRLSIVTDDVLHGVPFGALPQRGGRLIERFAISSAFEIDPVPGRAPGMALAASGLVVCMAETPGYDALPGVERECEHVMAWMTRHGLDATCLRDEQATPEQVVARLPNAAFVHFACHGDFEPEQPDRSGIMLSGPGTTECLCIRDLTRLRLDQCQHVTFAACWSGDSFILPARWIISLPEVLWRSGAQSVLASLWQVVDEVSGPLCERFYRNLESMPRDLALQDAQLACLRGELLGTGGNQPPASLPFFWAGFTLCGAPHRIRLRP